MTCRAVLILSCFGLALGCAREPEVELRKPRNLLVVTLDTTRADRMSAYGYERETTPQFDRLASEGTLFEHGVSVASITPTSHASILTGLWPFHHGVRVIYAATGYKLDPGIPSLPSLFQESGYRTGGFVSSFTASEYFGFDHGFQTWETGLSTETDEILEWKPTRDGKERAVWDGARHQRRSDETVDQAMRWLASSDDPFFCWVHLWDPHDVDLLPPAEWLERFPAREDEDERLGSYDAEVAYMDHNLGRLLDSLRQSGRYEDTAIVVVADHGEGLGDHGWLRHRLLYQEQIRVPFVMKLPGAPAGVRVSSLVRTVDIFPTLLSLFDMEAAENDGESLLGHLSGGGGNARVAYADALNEWDRNSFILRVVPEARLLYCVMDDRWKLIHHDDAEERSELYDLSEDPSESNNLYTRDHPEARRLKELLDDRFAEGYRRQPFRELQDPEVEEKLRSLGYLGGR